MAAPALMDMTERRRRLLRRLAALKRKELEVESERLKNIDVFAEIGYTPFPKQIEFHEATEYAVLYGGSLGGGKSRALTAEGIKACVKYPGIRVGAFRRTYGELKESLLAELATMDFARAVGAKWNGSQYELHFPNGSLFMFRYAETMKDATRRQGGQYQLLMVDELTLMAPDVVAFLESRIRSGRADIPVLGFRASANPGGPGHGATRNRFIDPTNYGSVVITDPDTGEKTRFVPSSMKDNPYLDEGYRRRLNALPEDLRRAFRDGDWWVFAGQMSRRFSRDRHVLTKPVELPTSWKRYNGVDWGYTAPWAVLWAAVDEDGRVWIYRELYQREVGESDQAKRILDAERKIITLEDGSTEEQAERISARYADDALWATRGEAKTIAAVYADEKVYLTRAEKGGRVVGWQRVRSYLEEAPACYYHRAMGWDTCPRIHLFPQVENLFKELRDLPHATKGDPEDADSDALDHAADALRYLLLNLGTGPSFPILGKPRDKDGLPEPVVAGNKLFAMRPRDTESLDDPVEPARLTFY